jgi:hypothetical protein
MLAEIIISYARTRNEDVLSLLHSSMKHDSISNINLKEIWDPSLDEVLRMHKILLLSQLYNTTLYQACAYCAIELGWRYTVSDIIYYSGLISQEKCEKKVIKLMKAFINTGFIFDAEEIMRIIAYIFIMYGNNCMTCDDDNFIGIILQLLKANSIFIKEMLMLVQQGNMYNIFMYVIIHKNLKSYLEELLFFSSIRYNWIAACIIG